MRTIDLAACGFATLAQAALRAGCHERTLRAWIAAGRIPVVTVTTDGSERAGYYLVRLADLDSYLADPARPQKGAPMKNLNAKKPTKTSDSGKSRKKSRNP